MEVIEKSHENKVENGEALTQKFSSAIKYIPIENSDGTIRLVRNSDYDSSNDPKFPVLHVKGRNISYEPVKGEDGMIRLVPKY